MKVKKVLVTKFLFFLILFSTYNFNLTAQNIFNNQKVKLSVFSSQDKVYPGSSLRIALKAVVDPEWHINSNTPSEDFLIPTEIKVKSDSQFVLSDIRYPEGQNIKFVFSDVPLSVYEGNVLIYATVKIPADIETGKYILPFEINYQSCNNQTCLPPAETTADLEIEIVNTSETISAVNEDLFVSGESSSSEDSLFNKLDSAGIFWAILTVFLGGLALNLTPCVYPLIPITIGYFGGQSEGRTSRLFVLGVLYVLGMAITYSAVGVITALSGAVFGSLLQNPVVIIAIVLIFLVLSLSMFGVYEFKLPDSWVAKAGGAKNGMFGAFFMGLTMGIVAAPCIGPFVLGLVTYVGAKGDPFYGFTLFFFLAVGLGTPYLILALFSGKIKSLPRAGMWMESVKHIFGLLLLGMAIYFLLPVLPKSVSGYFIPVFLILSAVYLIFFEKSSDNIKIFRTIKVIISLLMVVVSIYLMVPSEGNKQEWKSYDQTEFQSAINGDKIIMDFYADWCIPCKELDAITFSDPEVQKLLGEYQRFKVDMTVALSDETEKIRNEFKIVGMPTIIIFTSRGEEYRRITGFISPEEFIDILKKVN